MNDLINDFFNSRNNPFGVPFSVPFGGFYNSINRNGISLETLQVDVKLSFEDSVKGCTSKISYNIKKYCEQCNTTGISNINKNKCINCRGTGVISNTKQSGMFFRTSQIQCNICKGTGLIGEPCHGCNGLGHVVDNINVQLVIPPVGDKEIKLVAQRGDIYKNQQGNVVFYIKPTLEGSGKFEGYKIEKRDDVSKIQVPLHTLLFGGKTNIETIYGTTEIQIPAMAKAGQQIVSKNLGVSAGKQSLEFYQGNHRSIIEIKYPEKTKLNDEIKNILTKLYEDENGENKNG